MNKEEALKYLGIEIPEGYEFEIISKMEAVK